MYIFVLIFLDPPFIIHKRIAKQPSTTKGAIAVTIFIATMPNDRIVPMAPKEIPYFVLNVRNEYIRRVVVLM